MTGGVASGKSTVSRILESKGAVIVDADVIAREVLAPGRPALDKVRARFGEEVFRADGTLDRSALAGIVFTDPKARADLEGISHPLILAEISKFVREIDPSKIVVVEAALLWEARAEVDKALGLDALVVVASKPEDQLERLRASRKRSADHARDRMAAQATLEEKLKGADYVIENYGRLEELEEKVNLIWDQIRARF